MQTNESLKKCTLQEGIEKKKKINLHVLRAPFFECYNFCEFMILDEKENLFPICV